MRGRCIECPDPPPPVMLAIAMVVLSFNVLVIFGTPGLISAVMNVIGDLQTFRGIGLMAVASDQVELVKLYDQLALLTLDFSYERSQCPAVGFLAGLLSWLAFDEANRCRPHSLWKAGV